MLEPPENIRGFLYGHKVYACAQAEQTAPKGTRSLIWLSQEMLVIQLPDYIYPYNLHNDVPPLRAARSLNELVCVYHEGGSLDPENMDDI